MNYPDMDSSVTVVQRSPFRNTYGSLELVVDAEGNHWLRMGDCFGPDFHGPLTPEHIAAFKLLAEL